MFVVGHKDETTVVWFQSVNEGIDCIKIQVICWFIENQQVRFIVTSDSQSDTRLLTTGKTLDLGEVFVACNTESGEESTVLFSLSTRELSSELFNGWEFDIKLVNEVLSEVAVEHLGTLVLASQDRFKLASE